MLRIMVVLRNVEYRQFQGIYDSKQQGDINCEASSQAGFILNYFLLNFLFKFLNFPKNILKFSISFQPGWQAETFKATLFCCLSGSVRDQ